MYFKKSGNNHFESVPTQADFVRNTGIRYDTLHIVTSDEENSRIVSTGFKYNTGVFELEVYVNGNLCRQKWTDSNGIDYGDYLEYTNFSVIFETGVIREGDRVRFRVTSSSYDYSSDNLNNIQQIAKDFYGTTNTLGVLKNNGQQFASPGIMAISYASEYRLISEYFHEGTIQNAIDNGIDSSLLKRKLTLTPGTWYIEDDITIPENITIEFLPGAKLEISFGKIFTINGGLIANPNNQIFSGDGEVVLSYSSKIDRIYIEYWGEDSLSAQKAINTGKPIQFLNNTYTLGNLDLIDNSRLYGPCTINIDSTASYCFQLSGIRKVQLNDIKIVFTNTSQTALNIVSASLLDYSFENIFYGIVIDSDQVYAGTIGINIDNSFINKFYGCVILMAQKSLVMNNNANDNKFYGCSLRSSAVINDPDMILVTNGTTSYGNAIIGGDIERGYILVKVLDGSLTISGGTYMEAHYYAFGIVTTGGTLVFSGNYLYDLCMAIGGGYSVTIRDNHWHGTASSSGWPYVRFIADVDTKLHLENNILEETSTGCIYAYYRWYDLSEPVLLDRTKYRTPALINDYIISQTNVKNDKTTGTLQGVFLNTGDYSLLPSTIVQKDGRDMSWATESPTEKVYGDNTILFHTDAADGEEILFCNVNAKYTELIVDAYTGDSVITVENGGTLLDGDIIAVTLDSGSVHYTTLNGSPVYGLDSTADLTLSDVLPSDASIGNAVVGNRWSKAYLVKGTPAAGNVIKWNAGGYAEWAAP